MPSDATSRRTFSSLYSSSSSGEWTPTIVRPLLAYRSCQLFTNGNVLRQLKQPNVQNSTSTTRPLRPFSVNGSELIQLPGANSGAISASEVATSRVLAAKVGTSEPNTCQPFVNPILTIRMPETTSPTTSRIFVLSCHNIMLPFLSDHLAEPGASDADSLQLSNNVRDIPALDT